MKLIAFLVSLAVPLSLLAQYDHFFPDPVPNNARLFKIGQQTVLIHPMDPDNRTHKWISFDSTLDITAAKKLVTPDPGTIVSQTYLESINAIIRVDQFVNDDGIQISAYVFDLQGNILHRKEIAGIHVPGYKLAPIPFYISQSPDKRTIAMVQAQTGNDDSLTIAGIVFNDQLTIHGNGRFTVPFTRELSDLYMPLVNDNKTIIVVTADRFDSYKLGSVLTSYLLPAGKNIPQKIQFNFDRIKIKDLKLYTPGDTLVFSALFSEKTNRKDIAGILHAGFDLKKQYYLPTQQYIYSGDILTSLKKTYGAEGRKGNLLNYLSLLPDRFKANTGYSYAFLQPAPSRMKLTVYDDINANAAMRHNRAANVTNSSPGEFGNVFSPVRPTRNGQTKNLLFFSFKDTQPETNHRFIKIKPTADAGYDFFTYFPAVKSYSVLHYFSSASGQP